MPMKGMRTVFFKSWSPSRTPPPPSPLRITFSESLMDENIEMAQSIITKWDSNSDSSSSCNLASLFSPENRHEAKQYLNSVKYLQQAMQYLASQDPASENLVAALNLMQTAMKRLGREFYKILKSNRDHLDPESISSHSRSASMSRSSMSDFEDESECDLRHENDSILEVERASMAAMADLRVIADCMISAGYAKECAKIYKTIRKSIIDEALFHLGVERFTLFQLQKMDWEVLEVRIKIWLKAVKVAVKTLFYGERILCDQVFSTSGMRESCFSEISREGALSLFAFAENVAKCKKTPEKIFRILDLYEAISDLWPEIEYIFTSVSTSSVRQTAVNALIKLGEAVRTVLKEFETVIQKETSKSPVAGGGVHPLTRYVMNYLTLLTDYSEILPDIVVDWPLTVSSPLPASYFGSLNADEAITSPLSMRLAWLILVTLCKLDGKAELYKDVALSYLFLANNLQYVVGKVRESNLRFLLGEDWIAKHEVIIQRHAGNCERMGWSKVLESLPEDPSAKIPLDQVKDHFRRFNTAFEETYNKQSSWIIPDPELRDRIKVSVERRIAPVYKEFYEKHGGARLRRQTWNESIVLFTPEDLGNYLSDVFRGVEVRGAFRPIQVEVGEVGARRSLVPKITCLF
ncbi:hypothetical protein SLEP1_g59382 [Rubroshorea leprosula]|uniref:Exocyst subunit Exo70 family protein n=1 Tax=Rubroshorea leprosula TaxID=152421 RepID=A0AAV5MTB4_9ROSI|nr:hypothetical protein SLEP1_g59382 [Rubroshorea leprosula]